MKPIITVAIIHAPGESRSHIRRIWGTLLADAGHNGISLNEAYVNPGPIELQNSRSTSDPMQLILVWGLRTTPDWEELVQRYCLRAQQIVSLIVVIHANAEKLHGTPNDHPFTDAIGHGVAAQKRNRMENFICGFFNGPVPYGYTKVRLPGSRTLPSGGECAKGPHWLELGGPDEISVVHYIFDAFVSAGLTRTQILHALIAQRVPAPPGMKRWTHCKVTAVLTDPVYMGANRHTGYYRHDVFPPLISKEQFYRAQAFFAANASSTVEFLKFHAAANPPAEECTGG